MRYRIKKSPEVDAMQLNENNFDEVLSFMNKGEDAWIDNDDQIVFFNDDCSAEVLEINDWILRSSYNTLFVCKPDIFEKTYERID